MHLWGHIASSIGNYGYVAVAAGLLLEHVGLPLPGETLLIAAALLAAHGSLAIVPLLALAWAASTLGNMIGYAIGRYGGHALILRYGSRVGVTASRLAQVEHFFNRYGDYVVIGARFVVVLRQLSGIAAGTLTMPWRRFMLFNAIGAALWVGWWGLMSYWLGQAVFDFIHGLGRIERVLLTLAACVAVAGAARLYWRRRG
jgi:membrane protein DedA with SNARE-associated domain